MLILGHLKNINVVLPFLPLCCPIIKFIKKNKQKRKETHLLLHASGTKRPKSVLSACLKTVAPGEHWFQGNLEFMLSQRGKPLLVHDGHTFGIQYVRKDKKYWQCNLSRKYNCKARVTTTETGDIIVTNNEHCHTEIRQHLRKDYQRQKVMMNALINLSTNQLAQNLRRQQQQQQQQHHPHHHQQQQHHQINNLNSICSQLQQTLTTPPQAQQQPIYPLHHLSPLAAHAATSSSAASMQRLLDLGKLSPNDHATLTAVLQKQQDDSEDNMPLDCGIRPAPNDETKAETQKVISLTKKDEKELNSETNNAEIADETFKSKHDEGIN